MGSKRVISADFIRGLNVTPNFLAAPDAEPGGSSIGAIAAYADAAATSPVDGTGGSPSSTIAVSTDSSLVGTSNFLWTKSGSANRQGEGWSQAFTIDSAYQSKPMTISAFYKVASGSYADNDVSLWVYDVTNSALIQPSSCQIKNTTGVEQLKCEFQAASNSTSYRLIFHTASTSTANYTLRFDALSVSPNTYNAGAVVTDWTAYTPTITGAGTATATSFFWRRVGSTLEGYGSFSTGTVAASLASITLPTGSIDTTKTSVANTTAAAGPTVGQFFATGASGFGSVVTATGTSSSLLYFGNLTANSTNPIPQNGSAIWPSTTQVSVRFSVPILGWSTAQVLSSETDSRIVDFDAVKSAGAVSTTTTIPTWTVVNKDSHGAFNSTTGIYTVPVAGDYFVSGHITLTTSASWALGIIKNGTLIWYGPTVSTYINTTVNKLLTGLIAGDQISLALSANATVTTATAPYSTGFSMLRLSGPSQIAASETVKASYYGSANQTPGVNTQVNFDTKIYDSHGAVTTGAGTWKFTAPAPGLYLVNSIVGYSSGTTGYARLYKNGSGFQYLTGLNASGSTNLTAASAHIQLLAGDTIDVRPTTAMTISGTAGVVYETKIDIVRLGN